MAYYVYILASRKHGTLYIGVTNDLVRRVYEHRTKAVPGFTTKYGVDKLVLTRFTMMPRAPSHARRSSRSGVGIGRRA